MSTSTPHDALFKQVFSQPDHAVGLLRSVLPGALVERIDWSSLRLCPGSFVDDALRKRHSDLLFSVEVRGRPTLIYVLAEHKSSADHLTVFQMLGYLVQIWQAYLREHADARRLPAVIPIVVHHGDRGWAAPTRLLDLIDLDDDQDLRAALEPYLPTLRLLIDDLSTQDTAAIRARPASSLARLALFALARARVSDDLMRELRQWTEAFRDALSASRGDTAVAGLMLYIMEVAELAEPELARYFEANVGDQESIIMTTANRLRAEGRAQERTEILLKLLRLRFGPIDDTVVVRVRAASMADLETWTERVLTGTSVADVLDGD